MGGVAAGLGGIFQGKQYADQQAAAAEDRNLQRFMAGMKLEELARPTSVVTIGPDGKPNIQVQQGTSPERLNFMRGQIGMAPDIEGGVAAPSVRVAPVPGAGGSRTPAATPAQRDALDTLRQARAAQNRYQEVDEQTARMAEEAGALLGRPVTVEEIKPGWSKIPLIGGMAKSKFRITVPDDLEGDLSAAPVSAPPAAPPPAANPPSAAGGMIRVRLKSTGQTGQVPAAEFDPTLYERI
jgi:hypothetical protein